MIAGYYLPLRHADAAMPVMPLFVRRHAADAIRLRDALFRRADTAAYYLRAPCRDCRQRCFTRYMAPAAAAITLRRVCRHCRHAERI